METIKEKNDSSFTISLIDKEPNKRILYFSLLKEALYRIWYKKYLWFFGFFVGGITFLNFNFYRFDWAQLETTKEDVNFLLSREEVVREILEKLNDYRHWVIPGLVFLLFLILIIFPLRLIAKIVLIKEGAHSSIHPSNQRLKKNFGIAMRCLGKVLLLDLTFFIFFLILFCSFLALSYLMIKNSYFLISSFAFFAILLLVLNIVVINLLYIFSLRILILQKERVFSSIKLALQFFKNFWSSSLITLMIDLGFQFVGGILSIAGIILLIIPLTLFGLILFLLLQKIGLIIGGALLALGILGVLIIKQSIVGGVSYLYWTFIFKNLQRGKLEN